MMPRDCPELTSRREHWLRLRRAVRHVVLENPDPAIDEVLFQPWEYQERRLRPTHTPWTYRPYGPMTVAIYEQHIESGPMSLRDGRHNPGRNALVAVACGPHSGEIGAAFVADYGHGINDPEGMHTVTAGVSPTEVGHGRVKPVVEDDADQPQGRIGGACELYDEHP